MTQPTPIPVVAGVIHCGDKIMIARRAPGKHLAGMWEFPGGKLEPGESPQQALQRELHEEFDIRVTVGEFIASQVHDYGDRQIELLAYHAELPHPCGPGNSHDAVEWIPIADLPRFPLAPADDFICQALLTHYKAK